MTMTSENHKEISNKKSKNVKLDENKKNYSDQAKQIIILLVALNFVEAETPK